MSGVELIVFGIFFISMGLLIGITMLNSVWVKAYKELYAKALEVSKHCGSLKEKYENRIKNMIGVASELSNQQSTLWQQLDGPNRGASHSIWKSGIIKQINILESDKVNVFRDILKEGYDLTISMVEDNGEIKKIKISEVINMHDIKNKSQIQKPVKKPNHLKAVISLEGNTKYNKVILARKPPKLKIVKDEVCDK